MLLTFVQLSFAQQEAQYTQYMYNTTSVNPAYAGSRNTLSITGLHRSQWVGINGAPETQTLNIHSPVGKRNRVGLGGSIIHEKIGPARETYFNIDYSYTIQTSKKSQLAFGLKAGGHLLNIDFNELNQFTDTDVLLSENVQNKFSPNIGGGLYYYTDKFYVGFSAPNILQTKHFDKELRDANENSFLASDRVNYYLIGGYVFDISESVKFKPATLLKAVSGSPLQVDVSANFLFYDKLTLGAAYRWSAAVSGLVGFQFTKSLMFGFAYDRETTELGETEFNSGSFEFLLRYELFKRSDDKILYPRFF